MMTSPLLYPLLTALCGVDGVLPMIPSEAAVLTAGVFAHSGTPTLLLVVLATALGVFIGDHFAYGLSRSVVGPRLISRSRRVSLAVAAAGRHLDRRSGLLIVTSRFLPGGRVTMNLACGTAGVPLSRFSPASAVAALAWAAYTAGLGYAGGAAFAENPLLGVAVGLVLSFVLGAIVELIRRRGARRTTRALRTLVSATTVVAVLAAAPATAIAGPVEADRAGLRTPGVVGGRPYGLGPAWRDTPCGTRMFGTSVAPKDHLGPSGETADGSPPAPPFTPVRERSLADAGPDSSRNP